MQRRHTRTSLLVLFVITGGCYQCTAADDSLDARALWLQGVLIADHDSLLARNLELVRGKWARMAMKPFDYFRGSLAIFWRDISQPSGDARYISSFMRPDLMQILLVGDPHPENYGTYLRDDGVLAMTFNDFDAARYGPYLLDPWRLAVGFEVLARSLGPLDGPDGRLAQEVARGYAAQVLAEVDGGKAELEVAEGGEILAQCVICADLLRRARRDGEALEILDFYTALEGDTRTLKADTFAPIMLTPEVIDDDLEPVSTEELAVIIDILAKNAHVNGLKPVAVKGNGIARLLGKGVSSYPLLRYVVLLEGPTTAASDDILLDIKEAVDSPDITGLLQWPPRIWSCHGERIVEAQRRLQGETWDVLAGWAEVGRGSFVVQGMSGYQKSARVDRIAEKVREGEWTRGDVEVFARVAGRLLGSAHVRSHRLGGEGAGALIAGVLRGKEEAFSEEVTRFAMDYGDIVVRDWERLVQLRAAYGPWLGARRGSQVVWRGQ